VNKKGRKASGLLGVLPLAAFQQANRPTKIDAADDGVPAATESKKQDFWSTTVLTAPFAQKGILS